jgi:hypothetical protein
MSSKRRNAKGKRRVPQHAYLRKMAYLQKLGAFKHGQVSMVDVAHDDWCAHLSDGVCHCDPDIRIRWQQHASANN